MNVNDVLTGAGRVGTAYASAARTTAQTGDDINVGPYTGIRVVFDATAVTSTPSVTMTIQGKDEISGKYYTLLAGAAVTGISTNVYKIFPGATAAANAAANDALPRTIRINLAVGDADSMTYSVGYSLF